MASHRTLQDIQDAIRSALVTDPGDGAYFQLHGTSGAAVIVTPAASGESRLLPDPSTDSTVSAGTRLYVVNGSDESFDLVDGGDTILEVEAGTSANCLLGLNNGEWSWHATLLRHVPVPPVVIGDGEELDLEDFVLQDQVNAVKANGKIRAPKGEIEISGTVTTPIKYGLVFDGHGTNTLVRPSSSAVGSRTTVVWASSSTSDGMIVLRGQHHDWNRMSLWGDGYRTTIDNNDQFDKYGGKPTFGFLVRYDNGAGSGKHSFTAINAFNLSTVFQAGEAIGENNCDNGTVFKVLTRECNRLFLSKHAQVLNWHFIDVKFKNDNITDPTEVAAFHIEGGGDLTADNFVMLSVGSILRLDQVSSSGGGAIGHNNGIFRFNNVKIDDAYAGQVNLCEVVDTANEQGDAMCVDVIYDKLLYSGTGRSFTGDNRAATMRGPMSLSCVNSRFAIPVENKFQSVCTHASRIPELSFYNCRLNSITDITQVLDMDDSVGSLRLKSVGCRSFLGERIPDYDDVIAF